MAHLKKDFPFHKVFDNKYAEQSYIAYLSKGKKKYVMNSSDFVRRDIVIVIDFIIRCNNAIGNRKPKVENIADIKKLYEKKTNDYIYDYYGKSTIEEHYKWFSKRYSNEDAIDEVEKLLNIFDKVIEWKDKFETDYEGFKDFIYESMKYIKDNNFTWIVGENIIYSRSLRDNALKKYYCYTTGDKGYEKFKECYTKKIYATTSEKEELTEQVSGLLITIADVYNACLIKNVDRAKELLLGYIEDNDEMESCKDIYYLNTYHELIELYEKFDDMTMTDVLQQIKDIMLEENKKYAKDFVMYEKIMIDEDSLEVGQYKELD